MKLVLYRFNISFAFDSKDALVNLRGTHDLHYFLFCVCQNLAGTRIDLTQLQRDLSDLLDPLPGQPSLSSHITEHYFITFVITIMGGVPQAAERRMWCIVM